MLSKAETSVHHPRSPCESVTPPLDHIQPMVRQIKSGTCIDRTYERLFQKDLVSHDHLDDDGVYEWPEPTIAEPFLALCEVKFDPKELEHMSTMNRMQQVKHQRKFAQEMKVPRLDLAFLRNDEIEESRKERKLRKQMKETRQHQKIKMEAVEKEKKREAAEQHRQEIRARAMLIQQQKHDELIAKLTSKGKKVVRPVSTIINVFSLTNGD